VEFDTKNRPIKKTRHRNFFFNFAPVNTKPDPKVKYKVAILVLSPSCYTKHCRSLKGLDKLCRRHLEMLGYHVVFIDPQHWNSMYMAEPSAKCNYLESQIFDPFTSKQQEESNAIIEEGNKNVKSNPISNQHDVPL